jgi:hypothetical protein
MKKLAVSFSLKFAFDVMKKNAAVWIPIVLLYIALQWIYFAVKPIYSPIPWTQIIMMWEEVPLGSFILYEAVLPLLRFVLSSLLSIFFIKMGSAAYKTNHKVTFQSTSWKLHPLLLKYMWFSIVIGFVTIVGFAALIVPGFIIITTYFWIFFILVNHPHLSMKELFRRSAVLSKGIRWHIFGYWLLLFIVLQLLNTLLIFLFGIDFSSTGLYTWKHGFINAVLMFLLTPTMFFSFSYLYHNLQEQEMEETE